MKIVVTGSLGYIGSVLLPLLVEAGHELIGIDTGYFESCEYYSQPNESSLIKKDIRDIQAADLKSVDAIVHLAALSNDALGELDSKWTYEINFHAALRLAKLAKKRRVPRFIYMSSCSVYGSATESTCYEETPVNPLTDYAKTKYLLEKELNDLADDNFSPVSLRNATVFGKSPYLRSDVVVNCMSLYAKYFNQIKLFNGGKLKRPLLHVFDLCRVIQTFINSDRERWHKKIYNIGNPGHNFTVKEIADKVQHYFPQSKIEHIIDAPDARSYTINSDKFKNDFPEFRWKYDLDSGIKELCEQLKISSQPIQASPIGSGTSIIEKFNRLVQLKKLISSQELNADLQWAHAKQRLIA